MGGMGVIVLFLAILPALGAGGFQLFRAEIPGPSKNKLSPKIANTAKTLWGMYLLLTLLCGISLWYAEMNTFDAICHSFTTIATGGFSTKNNSIQAFTEWETHAIIIFFMFLSGCNFILFIHLIKGQVKVIYRNEELRLYIFLVAFGIFFTSVLLYINNYYDGSILSILKYSSFQVVCIITSTGYATTDYDLWPMACQFFIIILMFTGACAGSTSGGIKVFRVLVALKIGRREIKQLLHPRAIIPLNIDGENISEALLRVILGFVSLFILMLGLFIFVISIIEGDRFDMTSIFSICVSSLSNIGPALNEFGPTDNYSKLHDSSKWILSFMMLLGRLELYSVLVIFKKDIWTQ
jgi:trk system potassium uptake protein